MGGTFHVSIFYMSHKRDIVVFSLDSSGGETGILMTKPGERGGYGQNTRLRTTGFSCP